MMVVQQLLVNTRDAIRLKPKKNSILLFLNQPSHILLFLNQPSHILLFLNQPSHILLFLNQPSHLQQRWIVS
jgi:hypothetical protein